MLYFGFLIFDFLISDSQFWNLGFGFCISGFWIEFLDVFVKVCFVR